ncbi:hypothetical protein K438DRAFT_1994382 [Mycena galopus ATCC 62051]|nr:hypothetical protein K438DRAFT_1994382 [Mycena galopus ATCC 62051]
MALTNICTLTDTCALKIGYATPLPSLPLLLPPNLFSSSLCRSEVGTGKEFERPEVSVDTVKIPVNVQTEALAADEHTTKIADVSAETDSDEQAEQVCTEMIALTKLQKVTEIINLWKRWEETGTLLRGVSDHRIFVLKHRYRFYLQDHMQDYM